MPNQYIYLLKKTGSKTAKIIHIVKVDDMRKAEKAAHDNWARYRRTLTEKSRSKWGEGFYKIGLSNDPQRRIIEINKNIFQDGETEWFLFPNKLVGEVKKSLGELQSKRKENEDRYSRIVIWVAAVSIILMVFLKSQIKKQEPEKEFNFRNLVEKIKINDQRRYRDINQKSNKD